MSTLTRCLKVTTYDSETEELVVVYIQTDRDDERVIEILQEIHPEWQGIRTDGPDFRVLGEPRTVQFGSGIWILLESIAINRSDGKGGKETWFGWLPIKEIETTDN